MEGDEFAHEKRQRASTALTSANQISDETFVKAQHE
jgi:hypothetical protein